MLLGIGKRVKTFVNNEVVTGEVKAITPNAVIVESGDEVFKVSMSDVEECDDTVCMEDTVDEAPTEKTDRITITRDDFKNALIEAISPEKFTADGKIDDPMFIMAMSLNGMMVGKNIEKELFGDND